MLFAHPSDFTPICTTEFIEFARRWDDFERLGVALVGISVDSVPSHIAWVRDIERIAEVQVKFPVIADLDFKVSKAYGLIHEAASDTSAVRAVFAIDPEQRIRAIIYYPMQLGRSVDELIRLFQGLKVIDTHKVSLPINWQPSQPVVLPPPATVEAAAKRIDERDPALTVKAWYLSMKQIETE
jgi:peroxiredoxin (alkyl hydroperoxide reductase subunit C)